MLSLQSPQRCFSAQLSSFSLAWMDCTITTSTESTHELYSPWWLDPAYAEGWRMRVNVGIRWLGWHNTLAGLHGQGWTLNSPDAGHELRGAASLNNCRSMSICQCNPELNHRVHYEEKNNAGIALQNLSQMKLEWLPEGCSTSHLIHESLVITAWSS